MVGVEELSTHLVMATELPGSSRRSVGLVLASPWGGGSAAEGAESSESSMQDFTPHFFFGCTQYLSVCAGTAAGGAIGHFPDVYWRADMQLHC